MSVLPHHSPDSFWRRLTRLTTRSDWTQLDPLGGLRGMLGVALPLAAGLLENRPMEGVIAASGALALGIGSFQKNKPSNPGAILLGALAMGLSTWVGTLAGNSLFLAVLLTGLWGFAGGLLFELGLSLSFVGNKAVLAILIAGGYPSSPETAWHRALWVCLGGVTQALLCLFEIPSRKHFDLKKKIAGRSAFFPETFSLFRSHLRPDSAFFQGALRLSLALAASDTLSRFLGLQKAYWMPMTVLIVLRPDFDQTFGRGMGRLAGTFLGAGLATGLTLWLHPQALVLIVLILLFAWLCFTLFAVNYALFALVLTAYVVFMVTLGGMPEAEAARDRLIGNLAGGFFALFVFVLWPIGSKSRPTPNETVRKPRRPGTRPPSRNPSGPLKK